MFNIHLQAYNKGHCMCHALICTTLGTFPLSQCFTLGFVDREVEDLSADLFLPQTSCATLGQLLNLCVSVFPSVKW